MRIPDTQTVKGREMRADSGLSGEADRDAIPWPAPSDLGALVLYDKIDRRLIDTFPASDAVAQY